MRKRAITFLSAIFVIAMLLLGLRVIEKDGLLNKPTTNDHYNYIAINQILMYVSNNGDGSHDPSTDGNGFYWPGGEQAVKSAIFEDGLIWGTKIGREVRVNGNTHRQGLQAGKILPGGIADNAADLRYKVYKVRNGWELLPPGEAKDDYQADYNDWPVEDGAPWVDEDDDGVYTPGVDHPDYIGDEVLWYVANDMDDGRATFTYGTSSIGLEFQTTIFGFNRTGDLGDIVFKKYLIINKGTNTCNEMIFGYWSDTDLGDAGDDFSGCDTVLSLGYTYNGDNDDGGGTGATYGLNPPAVGYDFFQGPIVPALPTDSAKFAGGWRHGYRNLGLTSFTVYINPNTSYPDPSQGVAQGSIEFYRYLTGFIFNGNPFIDPHTGQTVKFVVPGDPVAGEGWYEGPGWPGGENADDRRHLMASGPITLAPGDSQEVVVGLIIARGTDNLNSITELKRKDALAQIAYDLDFNLTPAPQPPKTESVEKDRQVILYWENNSEDYFEIDPLISGQDSSDIYGDPTGVTYQDTTYVFEGYRVWQFSDLAGTDPRLIGIYDLDNGITTIYTVESVNGILTEIPAINSLDEGLKYHQIVENDAYYNQRMRNGTPYYFAITAYGYSQNSIPQFLESSPVIFEVFPGTQKIDETIDYDSGDNILADQISGPGDGIVELKVVDPYALTGDEYRVVFNGSVEGLNDDLSYTFINYTHNDTILADCTDWAYDDDDVNTFELDSVQAQIIDGFILKIQNTAMQEIAGVPGKNYAIKDVSEVKGPGGSAIDPPLDVFENLNSTAEWEINTYGVDFPHVQNINMADAIEYKNYEIRFTSTGSEYYLTGGEVGFKPWMKDDPKAKDRVPFEIWDVGRLESDEDDIRLTVKVLDTYFSIPDDSNRVITDSTWSQLENGDWEPILGFFMDSTYQEPLPETSGRTRDETIFKFGKFIFSGEQPAEGTVIAVNSYKSLSNDDMFSAIAVQPDMEDFSAAQSNLDMVSVFPNPYFGANSLERDKYQRFVRFTNLPTQATVRIFSLAGVFIQRIEKNDDTQWLDWDLRNKDGLPVASGLYIIHIRMPNVGDKVLKLAVILETQYIDRL